MVNGDPSAEIGQRGATELKWTEEYGSGTKEAVASDCFRMVKLTKFSPSGGIQIPTIEQGNYRHEKEKS